ncbi:MAG TPA: hypothetical protein VMH39_07180, partial [Gemmatimonadaceae bacterium]|nr:hypothetical protein [Gemmatimonadaceae bacterium]
MMIAWMWHGLVVGSLVAAAAAAAERLARLVGRQLRWVWVGAIVAAIVVIATAPFRAGLVLPVVPGWMPTAAASGTAIVPHAQREIPGLAADAGARVYGLLFERPVAFIASRTGSPAVERGLGVVWGGTSLGLLALLCVVEWRFRRARQRWPREVVHGATVRVSPGLGPAVIGCRRPEIVVPHWLLHRDSEEQHLVLIHELEHLR